MIKKQPSIFLPHGGGPWPFMKDDTGLWRGLREHLAALPRTLPERPRAVVCVTAHWETPEAPCILIDAAPTLLFDYFGFPSETYQLAYPAPGAPELAGRVRELLHAGGLNVREASGRGFDHGVFIPFMMIYPDADMPILEMSLHRYAPVETHIAIGRALAPLREEGVLIVGSGMSYHNLHEFFSTEPQAVAAAREFDDWLTYVVERLDASTRNRELARWTHAPGGGRSHPTPEHLEPLFVVAGAAGEERGARIFRGDVLGKPYSTFQFS